jgi:hypothetical protein
MSASAIAAARLKNARERRLQEIAGELGVLSAEASRRLHTALLAHDSGAHALNPSSRFEPLMQDGVEHALSVPGARLFSSHKTFQLPRSDQSPGFDTVHHLVLAPDHSAKLNEGLKQFALVKERQAKAASRAGTSPDECRNGSGALPHPKNRSTAGVLISNEGGFQSYSDLFDYADLLDQLGPHEGGAAVRQTTTLELNEWGRAEFDDASVRGRRHCHELHRVASAALDELGCTPMANAAPHSLHPENPSHSLCTGQMRGSTSTVPPTTTSCTCTMHRNGVPRTMWPHRLRLARSSMDDYCSALAPSAVPTGSLLPFLTRS